MVVGKSYKDNAGFHGRLTNTEEKPGGAGGSGNQEPSYILTFEDGHQLKKSWDDKFDEVKVTSGGRRKSRRNKKSRKTRRKSSRR